jgi:nitroreductase
MEILEAIYSRRSIRQYTKQSVERDHLLEIIRAGTWAPSGLNNQPWRFVIIKDKNVLNKLAEMTKYHKIVKNAPACIAVFVDRNAMYNDTKDFQGMGACLQNMLLAAHALNIGAVWLGEILKNGQKVVDLLELTTNLELMAVIAVGHPASRNQKSTRKELSEVILKEI